jgi:beta-lactamase regulating signal transducer with metallopeptidase domain
MGLILAVVTGVTIVLTKKSTAALRYKLMTGYLLLFTIAIVITFFIQFSRTGPVESKSYTTLTTAIEQTIPFQQNVSAVHDNVLTRVYNYLTTHSSVVVLIWFIIVWIKYVRFSGGLYHIYQLKRKRLVTAGKHWETKVTELSKSLGIKRKVAIIQSGLTKIPLTVGHLKPLILIPIGLLNNLSAAEVEAILLHELSHIKRKDYLVNMLQSILEMVFFFNPAVLWLSTLIKAERENCCDDMVIGKTSDKATYIQALLSCQEYNADNKLAMAFAGRKTSLIGRVRRIASNHNQTLNKMEKGFLTFSIITAILITLTVSTSDAKSVQQTLTDTAQHIREAAAEAKQMMMESKKMKAESMAMEAESKKMAQESKELRREALANQAKAKGSKNAHFIQGDSISAAKMRIKSAEMELKSKQAGENSLKATQRAKEAEEKSALAEKKASEHKAAAKIIQDDILSELISEGIVKNTSNLSYQLSATAFIVNGKKQAAALHKKLAQKYIKNNNATIQVKYNASDKEPVQFGWMQN